MSLSTGNVITVQDYERLKAEKRRLWKVLYDLTESEEAPEGFCDSPDCTSCKPWRDARAILVEVAP